MIRKEPRYPATTPGKRQEGLMKLLNGSCSITVPNNRGWNR